MRNLIINNNRWSPRWTILVSIRHRNARLTIKIMIVTLIVIIMMIMIHLGVCVTLGTHNSLSQRGPPPAAGHLNSRRGAKLLLHEVDCATAISRPTSSPFYLLFSPPPPSLFSFSFNTFSIFQNTFSLYPPAIMMIQAMHEICLKCSYVITMV